MKDILSLIAYIVFLLTIAFTMILGFKARVKEIQKTKEELRKEGKLLSPKKRLMYVARYFGMTIGSSAIIIIIITYIRKLEFSMPYFLGGVFVIFIIEIGIGAVIGAVKHVIERTIEIQKKEGTIAAIIILVMFIILEASYLYIKDFK